MANKNPGGKEKGSGPHRNQIYEDDGVYHPYRRHHGGSNETTTSTSGAPPIAHMPRPQRINTMQDCVPPRAHSSTSSQFSTPSLQEPMLSPQGRPFNSPTPVPPHRVQVPDRAPTPARPAAAASRVTSEQNPIARSSGTSAPNTTRNIGITVGRVRTLIGRFNQMYPISGSGGDSNSEELISDDQANLVMEIFNQFIQNQDDEDEDTDAGTDSLADVQYGGPQSLQKETWYQYPENAPVSFQPQNIFYDQPSTSYQPYGAPMPTEPECVYVNESDNEPFIEQAPHREETFGNLLAECLGGMTGEARVDAEKRVLDCLHNLRKEEIKNEVVDLVSPPCSPVVISPPVEESAPPSPQVISREPDAEHCVLENITRPVQQASPPQQQWSQQQPYMEYFENPYFENMGEDPVTIYSQVYPSHVESFVHHRGQYNMFFSMQRMFRPPQPMPRPTYTQPNFFNERPNFFPGPWNRRF